MSAIDGAPCWPSGHAGAMLAAEAARRRCERRMRNNRSTRWGTRLFAAPLLAVAFWLTPVTSVAAASLELEGFKSCWGTVKSVDEFKDKLGKVAEHFDAECGANYEIPAFWTLTGALVAAKSAGWDCHNAEYDKYIAGVILIFLEQAEFPLDEGQKQQLKDFASGQAKTKLADELGKIIPALTFYGCACDLAHIDEELRRFLETAKNTWANTKNCAQAAYDAILSVPSLVAEGAGFILSFLGSVPGVESIPGIGQAVAVAKGLACSNDLSGWIYEKATGDKCKDGPSPEEVVKKDLNSHLSEICADPTKSDEDIDAIATKGDKNFAKNCKAIRDNAQNEQKVLLCAATGGSWQNLGQLAFCLCPGHSQGIWCEPQQPCPPPYVPEIK